MAACKAGVLVSGPANNPATWAGATEKNAQIADPKATRWDASASAFTLRPKALVNPPKNCFPYWMPIPYTNMTKPS